MSRYDAYLILHIVAAILWLGAAFTLFLLSLRAQWADDPAETGRLAAINDWLAPRLFIPSSLAVFVFGLAMVVDGPWSFDTLWISIGIAGYAASFLTGILYLKPESERISAAVARSGPTSPEVQRYVRRIEIVSRAELGILFAIVVDMVVKPTADDLWLLVGGAAAIVAVALVAIRTGPTILSPATD